MKNRNLSRRVVPHRYNNGRINLYNAAVRNQLRLCYNSKGRISRYYIQICAPFYKKKCFELVYCNQRTATAKIQTP